MAGLVDWESLEEFIGSGVTEALRPSGPFGSWPPWPKLLPVR